MDRRQRFSFPSLHRAKVVEVREQKKGRLLAIAESAMALGRSEYPKDSDTLKDLIQFADEGLYKTKENGGNDVTIYSSISG